jgi:hypothetical protein
MQRGVGVAGSGVGLLNGQAGRRVFHSFAGRRGRRGSLQSRALGYGTASPRVPGSCSESF